jgi:hypothetical protein
MDQLAISDYALIGDTRTAALVSKAASIEHGWSASRDGPPGRHPPHRIDRRCPMVGDTVQVTAPLSHWLRPLRPLCGLLKGDLACMANQMSCEGP